MNILCLCPTYGRPRLVANALACFLAQDYPEEKRRLVILDDAGQIPASQADGWAVISMPVRYNSLPDKYNALLSMERVLRPNSRWDAVAVWDDDDIYFPWHLSAAAKALGGGSPSCKPRSVWSLYNATEPFQEDATGRFHGSLVVSVPRLRDVGGWIPTRRADFDQQQIAACGPAADMLPHSPDGLPGYAFRWQSTKAPHCQGLMSSPANEDWYDRYRMAQTERVEDFAPQFDEETTRILRTIC